MRRWIPIVAAAAFLLWTLVGCAVHSQGPSGARVACTSSCESQHNQCILAALNPQSIEYCDRDFAGCLRGCPPQ